MKTIAIVIGISNYKDPAYESLPGAHADANRFAASLISWGLPKNNIYFLSNEKATKTNIVKTFYDCRPSFDVEAKFIFYFAGHGVREKHLDQATAESYLVCHDTLNENLQENGFRLVELMQLLHILNPTQAYLFIDACSLRLNQLKNPLNEKSILSTTNSKGLFCLLSSGIQKSYEDGKIPYGYFTHALLKSLGELRHNKDANCYDIAKKVTHALKTQQLPPPEVYHIGLENMWLLNDLGDHNERKELKDKKGMILRWEALGEIQDHLLSSPDKALWMWGEGGMGKTVIAEQLCSTQSNAVYVSLSASSSFKQLAMEQIRSQKGELFFNRPPETSLTYLLNHIVTQQPDTLIVFDHLDRLQVKELESLIQDLDEVGLRFIFISRYPCPLDLFKNKRESILEWLTLALSVEEVEQFIIQNGQDPSIAPVVLNASKGNALQVKQLLGKLLGEKIPAKEKLEKDYIKSIKALTACGSFLDEHLFCKTFHLKSEILSTLERLGLIRYTANGCIPHDYLIEIAEEQKWPLEISKACTYWKNQIKSTPYNRWACRSLVVLAAQIGECEFLRKPLAQCLETLNDREHLPFLIDLVTIFQKNNWEDLLLKASDYLIDHEEYKLAGEVIKPLLNSIKQSIRNHASKNDARRLVWLGYFGESIESNKEILKNCKNPQVIIPLKNNIGIAHFFSGDLDFALKLFKENISFKGKKDERELGIAKLMSGVIFTYRGEEVSKAKELLESSLQIFETTKFYLWNIVALNSLGDLSYRLEQWRQAIFYLNKAIDIAEALQNKTFLLFSLKNVTRVYLRLFGSESQELSMTVENLEMVLEEVLKTGPNWVTVWAQNVLGTIYSHRKEIDKLEAMMNTVAPLTQTYKECHIFTLSNLGHLAALKNEFDQAKQLYQEALVLTEEVKNPFALHEIKVDFLGCGLPRSLQPFNRLNSHK